MCSIESALLLISERKVVVEILEVDGVRGGKEWDWARLRVMVGYYDESV